jgi:predicted permease
MSLLHGARSRLRSLLRRNDSEDRLAEEFRFHVDMQTEKHIARGLSPGEARRQALLDFGGVERHGEALRDTQRPRLLAELAQDARFTARSLRHNRSFALIAVLVVSLGVGATTALFSLANALLFRELPVPSPDELYVVQEVRRGSSSIGMEGRRISYDRYEAYREASGDLFSGLAAQVFLPMSIRTDAATVPVQGALTSANFFRVLSIRPALGRFFAEERDPVVVLSHRAWLQRFGGDTGAVGSPVTIDGRSYTVGGVAPPGFHGTVAVLAIDVWVPYRAHVAGDSVGAQPSVGLFGRVREAGRLASTAARLTAFAIGTPLDVDDATVERVYLVPMQGLPESARGPASGFLGMLVGAGFLVLLIGAANIAALLLARAVARRREVALRLALGAGRGRLVRQLLTESTLLFLGGGIGGIAVAWWLTTLLSRLTIPGRSVLIDATPDARVLGFALAIAAITGLVFGLAPAFQAVRLNLSGALKDGAASGGTTRLRARSLFVGAQVAFAMLLLITAGLFVRGLQRGLGFDPGFDAAGVVVGTFDLEPLGIGEEEGRVLQMELLRRVRALPDVQSASLARITLLTGDSHSNDVRSVGPDSVNLTAAYNAVDTAYFRTMGIALTAGRTFGASDTRGSPPVVIINETLAQRLWPGQNPLGRKLWRGREYEVIGVARDGKYVSLGEPRRPFMFFATEQHYAPVRTLHARGRGNQAQLIEAIRGELRAVHPDVALELAAPLEELIGFGLLPQRLAAGLIGAFGLLGLLLAAAGVYGVMSYHVAQRTREFGIRIALGARARDLQRLVLGGGLVLAIGGAVAGALMAAAVTRLLAGLLFGLSPLDPVTFGSVAGALVAVAAVASWIPARRALRVDPTVSLRSE